VKLHTLISQYVAWRQSLGELFRSQRDILNSFCRRIGPEVDAAEIQPDRVSAFLAGAGPVTLTWHNKYQALKGLYHYALSRGYLTTSPLPTVVPKRPQTLVAYIYSSEELQRLLAAAFTYQKRRESLEPETVHTILLLLYGAGLRVSEALSLTLAEVDLRQAVLTIRNSKFFTSRLVPVGNQLNDSLKKYASHRLDAGHSQIEDGSFFVKRNGRPVNIFNLQNAYRRILKQTGISRTDVAGRYPRLHDLRHAFAVHRLTAWYQEGKDVQKLLPQLSVYMGHRKIAHTSTYLTMTPELLHHASQLFEQYALKGGSQ
jgi:site-specific recombinase XerD